MNYGNYAVLENVEHTFEKEPDWTWSIKPVTMQAELDMAKFTSRDRFVVFPDGARAARPITTQEIALHEIALTFASTNIPGDDEKPILVPGASVEEIESVLCTMPPDMVKEIWKAVGEACPPWGPALPKDDQPKKAPSKKK
jgi:hypothetical protein